MAYFKLSDSPFEARPNSLYLCSNCSKELFSLKYQSRRLVLSKFFFMPDNENFHLPDQCPRCKESLNFEEVKEGCKNTRIFSMPLHFNMDKITVNSPFSGKYYIYLDMQGQMSFVAVLKEILSKPKDVRDIDYIEEQDYIMHLGDLKDIESEPPTA